MKLESLYTIKSLTQILFKIIIIFVEDERINNDGEVTARF